jgi:hypothetical protein
MTNEYAETTEERKFIHTNIFNVRILAKTDLIFWK